MLIREVKDTDISKGLLNVFIEGFRYHYNGRPDIFSNKSDEELKEDLINSIMNDNIMVLEDEDRIVGYIQYEIREKHAKTMWVDQLVIDKQCQKKGYGKLLLDKVIELAKQENCERIELECWAFNDNAVGMYNHIGFSEQRVKLEKKL
ncbi:MAG: GNAT family N-acetyltransferase [Bacilli bacterium]|nr:GNAT family N-acetyltransferase [Bacilli bacterium]